MVKSTEQPPNVADRKLTWRRQASRLTLFIIGCYLGTSLMLAGLQRKLIYLTHQDPAPVEDSGYDPERIDEILLTVEDDVQLHGWYCKATSHETQSTKHLALVFPGNAGNRLNRVRILNQLNDLGLDALIFDYRGYGGSSGTPTEEALASDAEQIWEYAVRTLGFESRNILVCGQSLGGGVATRLAWERCLAGDPPGGLFLRATFTSLVDAAKHNYPWLPVRSLLVDRYPSVDRIPEVTCPVFIYHGRLDNIVPFVQGKELFDAAPEKSSSGIPKKFLEIPEAGHNDIMFVAEKEVFQATKEFLASLGWVRGDIN